MDTRSNSAHPGCFLIDLKLSDTDAMAAFLAAPDLAFPADARSAFRRLFASNTDAYRRSCHMRAMNDCESWDGV